jgi:hypothetical protein
VRSNFRLIHRLNLESQLLEVDGRCKLDRSIVEGSGTEISGPLRRMHPVPEDELVVVTA